MENTNLIGILLDSSFPRAIFRSQVEPMIKRLNMSNVTILTNKKLKFANEGFIAPKILFNSYFQLIKNYDFSIIYLRGAKEFICIYILRKLLGKHFLIYFDFRGLAFAESSSRHKSKFRSKILWIMERYIYKKADRIFAVSNKLKNYLQENFGFREVYLMPCYIENVVMKKFNNKSMDSALQFVYIGGVSSWQKIDLMIDIFNDLQNQTDLPVFFTIYSQSADDIKDLVTNKNIKNIILKTENNKDILNKLLLNYDFGFLLRDNILLNNVSSPVKFAEYIGNGIIPILTEGIGDYSDLVLQNNIGLVIKESKIKIEKLYHLRNDKEIYDRLYESSKKLTWNKNEINFI